MSDKTCLRCADAEVYEKEIARLTQERDYNAEAAARDVSAVEAEVATLTADLDRVCRELGAEKIEHSQARADRDALREENGRLQDGKMRAEARHLDAEARAATAREEADALRVLLRSMLEEGCREPDETPRGCHCFYAVTHSHVRDALLPTPEAT